MLSIFFPRKKREKQNHFLDNELDGSLLAQKDFATRLRHERLRSERSGSPIALVIIDFAGLLDFVQKRNAAPPRVFVRHLADILRTYTREIDLKGWYPEGKVALLATDTNERSAQVLVKNIAGLIGKEASSKAALKEYDLTRFISISSLEKGRRYLANSYSLEFSCPAPDELCRPASNGTTCLVAAPWPFSF